MRIVATAAAVLIAACAGAAAAQDRPAAYANAEDCLETNVDAAVAASSGAADAAEFLLGYLCAGPVAAATKYDVNSGLLASGRGLVEGFLTTMSAGTAMTEDSPDFDAMTDEEIDAWIQEQEAAAAADGAVSGAASEAWAQLPPGELILTESGETVPAADPFEGISVDPVTGEIVAGENPIGPMIIAFMDYLDAAGRSMSDTPPVFLREHAARLIVQRRR